MARWRYGSSQGLRDRKSCRRVDRHEGVLAWKAAPRNSCVCGAYARGGALEYWAKQIIERADAGMGEIYFLNPLMSLGQHVSVVKNSSSDTTRTGRQESPQFRLNRFLTSCPEIISVKDNRVSGTVVAELPFATAGVLTNGG